HSASSDSHRITINKRGDYLLFYNDHLTSNTRRTNPRIQIQVDGVDENGGQVMTHYNRNSNGHNESSAAMVFLLKDMVPGNVVTSTSRREAASGTVNDASDALLTIWKK